MSGVTDADFGYPMWRGFITWAYDDADMRAAFVAETGRAWPTEPKNVLERMIDKATSRSSEHALEFTLWATRRHWGVDDAPEPIRDLLRAREDRT